MATVKKRLQRGLAQLRETLDERYGGERASWMSAVTALAVPVDGGAGTGTLVIGGIAMGTMMKVAAAVLLAAAGLYFVTRTPQVESPRMATVEPPATEVQLVEPIDADLVSAVEGPATAAGRRSRVTDEAPAGVAAVEGTKVLRVILEGIPSEDAGRATVTVTGVEEGDERSARIRDTWPCQGLTSEFDLDPILARLAERPGESRVDEVVVVVDHPLRFSESTRVALSSGVELASGRTVYEVPVRLAEVVYWPELTLAVRDAHTRAHLEDVELRCVPTAYMGLVQQPGTGEPFTVIGGGLSSPVVLQGGRKANGREGWAAGLALRPPAGEAPRPAQLAQPEENERGIVVYARAPGHAWGRIVLDVSKGAERELLLEPAAALRVRFANVQLERYSAFGKEATLCITRIRPDGDEDGVLYRRLDETLQADGLRIEALEPGELAVSVELGGALSMRKRPLAREEITLVAGETRELILALADAPAPLELAHLGGVVAFPAFGGEDRVRLQLFLADYLYGKPDFELSLADMEPVGGELPTWAFRLEDLPVGLYQARLVPFEKDWMIVLPAGGTEDVALVLPELAEVLVETVDARTGERIPLQAIRYGFEEDLPGRVRHEWSWTRTSTEFEDEPGRFRFWTAPGTAYVRTYWIPEGLNVGARRQDLELVPGPQTVRFELAPANALRFEFRVDGAALPREDGIFTGLSETVRAVGHEGRVQPMTYQVFEASTPGLYEIGFEGVGADRFLPIPPRRVEVREGETTEVIVELRRK